jgi:hypothetical protein
MPAPVRQVPPDQVGAVVQTFVDAGCKKVEATKELDGTYTVTCQ